MKFVTYDLITGRMTGAGTCPDRLLERQAGEGEGVLRVDDFPSPGLEVDPETRTFRSRASYATELRLSQRKALKAHLANNERAKLTEVLQDENLLASKEDIDIVQTFALLLQAGAVSLPYTVHLSTGSHNVTAASQVRNFLLKWFRRDQAVREAHTAVLARIDADALADEGAVAADFESEMLARLT